MGNMNASAYKQKRPFSAKSGAGVGNGTKLGPPTGSFATGATNGKFGVTKTALSAASVLYRGNWYFCRSSSFAWFEFQWT